MRRTLEETDKLAGINIKSGRLFLPVQEADGHCFRDALQVEVVHAEVSLFGFSSRKCETDWGSRAARQLTA